MTVGALNPFVAVVVFAFAFGLSMDYEVFLLGRIKEYVDSGVPTGLAVRRGLQHTGRVITSAALMVIVFACFAAARMGSIEQIGLGLAVAVLIDADRALPARAGEHDPARSVELVVPGVALAVHAAWAAPSSRSRGCAGTLLTRETHCRGTLLTRKRSSDHRR